MLTQDWTFWTYGEILLVGKDQEKSITEFVLIQHALKFFAGLNNTVSIVGVHDEDDALSVLEVVSPQRSNLVLPAHIPHCELNVLVFDCLNVETWVWLVWEGQHFSPRHTDCWDSSPGLR